MFRTVGNAQPGLIELVVDQETFSVPAGISVAAALLYLGIGPIRHTLISHAPRAPYCMMGVCMECLIEIDGVPNQCACQVTVRQGMQIKRHVAAFDGEQPL